MSIYVSGPHKADDYRNIVAHYFSETNIPLLDPLRPERDFRGVPNILTMADEVVRGDLEDIINSKLILADFSRGEQATGTAMECWFGFSIGRPVIAYTGTHRVSPWTHYVTRGQHYQTLYVAMDRAAEVYSTCP